MITSPKSTPHKKHPWRIGAVIVSIICLLVLVATLAFLAYTADYYHAFETEDAVAISSADIPITRTETYYAFGDPNATEALIFYPGAKVDHAAYAPLMHALAAKGYLAIVVQMPFNLAFLDIGAADGIRADFPAVERWWVGGHSLGGAMAAQYAAEHANDLTGLVLLGAYTATDLSATSLKVCILYGTEDKILDRSKLEQSASLLPSTSSMHVIEGGNHAFFGYYGEQAGDGRATITPQEQWRIAADTIASYVGSAS